MPDRPRILKLSTSLRIGGAEKLLTELVRGLRSDFDLQIGYFKEYGATGEELTRMGFTPRRFSGLRQLTRHLKEWRPQLIHTYLYRDRIYGRLAGKLTGIPVICSNYARDDWRSLPLVWLDRITAPLTTRTITNSRSTRDLLIRQEKLPADRVTVIAPGLPADFHPQRIPQAQARARLMPGLSPGPVLGTVSRLHYDKGSDFWPEIAEGILKAVPKAHFYLVGDGPLRDSIQKDIDRRGLGSRVHLLGWVDDIGEFLSALDVFALCSREESFSQALLEAASAGLPFVAADVGGTFELLEMGAVGRLVPARNLPAMIDTCVGAIRELPGLGDRARAQSASIQKQASMQRMIDETAQLYRKIL